MRGREPVAGSRRNVRKEAVDARVQEVKRKRKREGARAGLAPGAPHRGFQAPRQEVTVLRRTRGKRAEAWEQDDRDCQFGKVNRDGAFLASVCLPLAKMKPE